MTLICIFFILLLLIPSTVLLISNVPVIHSCQVESYTETINLRTCSSNPISIKTTRCRGQCYSEDALIYDWQYSPTHYRHQHYLHCCSPNETKLVETQIPCVNTRLQTLKYRLITQCECKLCNDHCFE